MKKLTKYKDICHYRQNQIFENINTNSENTSVAASSMNVIIPILLITTFFEWLWKKIFVKNQNR